METLRKKEIDVFVKAKEAFDLVLNNKILWLLGAIYAVFGGTSSGYVLTGGNSSFGSFFNKGIRERININDFVFEDTVVNIGDKIDTWSKSGWFLLGALICGLVLFVIGVVVIYMRIVWSSSIIYSVPKLISGEKLDFVTAFKIGNKSILKVVMYELLLGFFAFVVAIVSLLTCCFSPIAILVVFVVGGWLFLLGKIDMLINNNDIFQSLENVYSQIRSNFVLFLKYWVVNIVIGIAHSAVVGLVLIPTGIICFLLVTMKLWFFIPMIVGVFPLLVAGISGPIISFALTYKTMFWIELTKSEMK